MVFWLYDVLVLLLNYIYTVYIYMHLASCNHHSVQWKLQSLALSHACCYFSSQDMADNIAYVAKDLFNQRGERQFNLYYDELGYNLLPLLLWKKTFLFWSVYQHVTSWSVPVVEPVRLSAASVRPLRLASANFSATRHRSSPATPGYPSVYCSCFIAVTQPNECTSCNVL